MPSDEGLSATKHLDLLLSAVKWAHGNAGSLQEGQKGEWVPASGQVVLLKSGAARWGLGGNDRPVTAPAALGAVHGFFPGISAIPTPVPSSVELTEPSNYCRIPLSWVHDLARRSAEASVDASEQPRNRFAEFANSLRALSCAAGFDPFLHLLRLFPSQEPFFVDVPQLFEGGQALDGIELRAIHAGSWQPLISRGQSPPGVLLVLNGLLRAKHFVAAKREELSVEAFLGPALLGELERPLGHAQLATTLDGVDVTKGTPAVFTIEVQASDEAKSGTLGSYVYYIAVDYGELYRLYHVAPALYVRFAHLERVRRSRWFFKLVANVDVPLRIVMLLKSVARAPESSTLAMPWVVFKENFPPGYYAWDQAKELVQRHPEVFKNIWRVPSDDKRRFTSVVFELTSPDALDGLSLQ